VRLGVAETEKAVRLLEEIREDPIGLDAMDLHRLLNAWEFEEEELETAKGWTVKRRYHAEIPKLDLVLPVSGTVHSVLSKRAVALVDELRRRRTR
jgi:hypothetical protein